ncbi:MAG: PAS domain S-box protein [Actinobacteria bacterium]|nr:PAS domain S-box protein [Actinomycetota bacterium]
MTEKERAEEALRESEQRFRILFEQAADSIVLVDPETHALVEFNDQAHENLGYARDEFGKLRLEDLEAAESPEEIKIHVKRIRRYGHGSFETRLRAKDGRLRDFLMKVRAVSVGGRDYLLGIWHDVTERKLVEDTLHFVADRGWQEEAGKFFPSLVKYLAEATGVEYVLIARLGEDGVTAETVAFFAHGGPAENITYPLKGTPCENVADGHLCCYPEGIQGRFPDDESLVDMRAESYLGVTLWNAKGEPLGLIAILDCKPFANSQLTATLLQTVRFAPRPNCNASKPKPSETG